MARVFSGIQPSGELHIGNYLGAVQNWVKLQMEHDCFICIVDYHAITQDYDAAALEARTLEMAVGLVAAGIDPERSVLFVQSHVPEHTELAWILTTVTPLGDLERMTQFKDKSQRQESILAGLLNYPVLQAADILLYRAGLVPVGEDQIQHLELVREIARKWNTRFAPGFFPEPQAQLTKARRIVGLDGLGKMSKSMGNTIGILEEPAAVFDRLKPAKTDPARVTKKDPGDPAKCNLYSLHQYFSPAATVEDVAQKCRTAGWGCLDCKRVLADSVVAHFAPAREKSRELRNAPERIRDILHAGAEKARAVATETMREVREKMGLLAAHMPSGVGR
ncbi:MAG: tryptophan--tRNA ligase [Gemmatimonadetes bacterium]|nr:tryptophan--tRNA ligase [Gemmatimonadota bacterium]